MGGQPIALDPTRIRIFEIEWPSIPSAITQGPSNSAQLGVNAHLTQANGEIDVGLVCCQPEGAPVFLLVKGIPKVFNLLLCYRSPMWTSHQSRRSPILANLTTV